MVKKKKRSVKLKSHKKLFKKRNIIITIVIVFVVVLLSFLFTNLSSVLSIGGYDNYGYNYNARTFVGKADGFDRNLDGLYMGYPDYANDNLVVKWSKEWDDAAYKGASWSCNAWMSMAWNGKVKGGSEQNWHYRVIWVGPELENSTCWMPYGFPLWNEFEVIFSQGTMENEHFWEIHSKPFFKK